MLLQLRFLGFKQYFRHFIFSYFFHLVFIITVWWLSLIKNNNALRCRLPTSVPLFSRTRDLWYTCNSTDCYVYKVRTQTRNHKVPVDKLSELKVNKHSNRNTFPLFLITVCICFDPFIWISHEIYRKRNNN